MNSRQGESHAAAPEDDRSARRNVVIARLLDSSNLEMISRLGIRIKKRAGKRINEIGLDLVADSATPVREI